MKKRPIAFMLFCLSLLAATGCWDMRELNDHAIILGIGIDLAPDGDYQVSAQFVIPSKMGSSETAGGGKGENFFVETGSGNNIYDALQNMQTKISRDIFRSQRQSIYIGERLARHGLREILDIFTRDPELGLRADISVIKGSQAKDALKISYPFESASAIASVKLHDQFEVAANTSLLDFLKATASESSSSSTLAWVLNSSPSSQGQDQKTFQFAGSAIFDKNLKLVGFLYVDETTDKMWISGRLTHQPMTTFIPQGDGKITVDVKKLKSKIKPLLVGNKVKIEITLSGEGEVKNNDTKFDLTQSKKVEIVEKELEKYYKNRVYQLIHSVQKKYGTDIFGFDDTIFRKHPSQWKTIKNEWDKKFSEADVSINVDLTIHLIGLTGAPEHTTMQERKMK